MESLFNQKSCEKTRSILDDAQDQILRDLGLYKDPINVVDAALSLAFLRIRDEVLSNPLQEN